MVACEKMFPSFFFAGIKTGKWKDVTFWLFVVYLCIDWFCGSVYGSEWCKSNAITNDINIHVDRNLQLVNEYEKESNTFVICRTFELYGIRTAQFEQSFLQRKNQITRNP